MKTVKKPISVSDAKTIELKAKISELQDKLARSLADYANQSKRFESQQQLFTALATASIITKMIDVLDNLNLANQHLKDPGLKMAIDQFLNILKEEGLIEITAQDKEFDPKYMECVATVDGPLNKVISVQKNGYLLNDFCLRPAKVIVGRKPENKNK